MAFGYREQWTPIRFVSGYVEAQASVVPSGYRALMMDSTKDSFYVKQREPDGSVSVTEYEFRRVEQPEPVEYATKADFDEMRRLLDELIASQQRPRPDWVAARNVAVDDG